MNAQSSLVVPPEFWSYWEREVVNGVFPLRRLLSGTSHGAVFLTSYEPEKLADAAIKFISADSVQADAQLVQWGTAVTLSHPHLVRAFDVGRCQFGPHEYLFIVMEYAEQNLAEILPKRALSPEEAKEMLLPTVDALAYLHRNSLVHGQLQPSNVMVVNDKLKLACDSIRAFGSPTTEFVRTPYYDPPELKDGRVSGASDIWDLGITLVEALTQRAPTWPEERSETVSLPNTLPLQFVDTARRCLSRSPARRPTASELKAQLDPAPLVAMAVARASAREPSVSREAAPTSRAPAPSVSREAAPTSRTPAPPVAREAAPMSRTPAPAPSAPPAIVIENFQPVTEAPPREDAAPDYDPGRGLPTSLVVGMAVAATALLVVAAVLITAFLAAGRSRTQAHSAPIASATPPHAMATAIAPAVIPLDDDLSDAARARAAASAATSRAAALDVDAARSRAAAPTDVARAVAPAVPSPAVASDVTPAGTPATRSLDARAVSASARSIAAPTATAPPTSAYAASNQTAPNPALAGRTHIPADQQSAPPPDASAPTADAPNTTDALHEELPDIPQPIIHRINGHVKVTVRVLVDPSGNVVGEFIETAGPSRYFARMASEAAEKWKFAPTDGRSPRVWLLRFEFTRDGATVNAATAG